MSVCIDGLVSVMWLSSCWESVMFGIVAWKPNPLCLSIYVFLSTISWVWHWTGLHCRILFLFCFLDWREFLGASQCFAVFCASLLFQSPWPIITCSILFFPETCSYFLIVSNYFMEFTKMYGVEFHPFTMLKNLAWGGILRYSFSWQIQRLFELLSIWSLNFKKWRISHEIEILRIYLI